ncbi:class II aldolase/adducin family protein [Amylibacter sp.]|nr:class II aldolase/adducin family protein [Amylibacter sp.]
MINSSLNCVGDIKKFCSKVGKDKLLVQGAGGNVSWKEADTMWIKASGTWLADALDDNIFVPVDLIHLKKAISEKTLCVTPMVMHGNKERPSIETILHALMPQDIVVHLHAVEVLSYLVRADYIEEFKSKVPSQFSWVNVEYARPGEELAKAVYDALESVPQPDVVFLQNHGIVIGAGSIKEVEVILAKVCTSLKVSYVAPELIDRMIAPIAVNASFIYNPIQNVNLQQLALNERLFGQLAENWAMYPDHVVFLGAKPFTYKSVYDLYQYEKEQQILPQLIFIKNIGVFTKDEVTPAVMEQLDCFYEVLKRQNEGDNVNTLSFKQVEQLLNWEAEEYRKKISK